MHTKGTLLPSLLLLLLAATPGSGQRPPSTGEPLEIHPEAKAAIDGLWSPYCPGFMLEVCTSSGGAMLRDSIQRMAERGMSSEAMIEVIVADYGEEWRAEPLRSGAGLWAWLIPPGILVVGLGLVGIVLARRQREPLARGPAREVAPEEDERIRSALKELDAEEEPVF